MDVSVIMINYNTFDLTKAALESVFAHTKGIAYEVILVDNLSPDGSGERLCALFEGKIVYLQAGGNLGTSKAFNLGLKHASGKYVLWLNTDILIKENFIKKLFDYMESDPQCGICGGNVLDFEGKPGNSFGRKVPDLREEKKSHSIAVWLFRRLFRRQLNLTYNYTGKPMRVAGVIGADMMIRSELFGMVGDFDEDIFMYSEEVEFTYRVTSRTRYTVMSVPDAHIYHLEGASFGRERRSFNEWQFVNGLRGNAKRYAKCYGGAEAVKYLKVLKRTYLKFRVLYTLLFRRKKAAVYARKRAIVSDCLRQFPKILEE